MLRAKARERAHFGKKEYWILLDNLHVRFRLMARALESANRHSIPPQLERHCSGVHTETV